jgi:WhiB family redox-sensing transcriptional regulator
LLPDQVARHPDRDWWFQKRGGAGADDAARAKYVCRRCLVAEDCLDYALRHELTDGIFGGFTAQERRKMKR